jgi:hypothetical protein
MKRTAASAVLFLCFGLSVMIMRVLWDGRQALVAGDEALTKGDVPGAITGWRRAARWYAPGAPHVRAAYLRLEELAQAAEAQGDDEVALEAWRAIRSSSLSTRSVYTPFEVERRRADEHIAALMAKADGGDPAERRAWHAAKLARDDAPAVIWTLVAIAGFAAWASGGFWLATRGFTKEDQLVKRTAARSALTIVIGLAAWVIGLALA